MLARLSSGPAFSNYRASCAQKVAEKNKALDAAATAALTKVKEMHASVVAVSVQDAVTQSYIASAMNGIEIAQLWQQSVNLDECWVPKCDADWQRDDMPKPLANAEDALHAKMEAAKDSASLLKDVKDFHAFAYFRWAEKAIENCESVRVLHDFAKQVKAEASVADQCIKGLNKIANDIKGYLNQLKRRDEQAQAKAKKDAEKKEMEAVTALAKKAASQIKKGVKTVNQIFQVPADKWSNIPVLAGGEIVSVEKADSPCIIKGSDAVKTWKANSAAAIKLSEFAAQYKKAPTFKADGRAQGPVLPHQGREEAAGLFDSFVSKDAVLDITQIQGGEAFMKGIFYFGYDTKLEGAWLSPNCAAMTRVLVLGEIQVVAFELQDLLKPCGDSATCDSISEFALAMNEASPHWSSVKGYRTVLQAGDCLYVPQGWLLCERCVSTALIYGVRKSFMVRTGRARANLEKAVEILKRSNRDPAKLQAVLECYPNPETKPS